MFLGSDKLLGYSFVVCTGHRLRNFCLSLVSRNVVSLSL